MRFDQFIANLVLAITESFREKQKRSLPNHQLQVIITTSKPYLSSRAKHVKELINSFFYKYNETNPVNFARDRVQSEQTGTGLAQSIISLNMEFDQLRTYRAQGNNIKNLWTKFCNISRDQIERSWEKTHSFWAEGTKKMHDFQKT